ncbi:MAG: altronate dehydratase, partial [Notoacmeibacter sp.]
MDVQAARAGILRLHAADNLVVTTKAFQKNAQPLGEGAPLTTHVPLGHKIATEDMPIGTAILKFGQIIGYATQPIG